MIRLLALGLLAQPAIAQDRLEEASTGDRSSEEEGEVIGLVVNGAEQVVGGDEADLGRWPDTAGVVSGQYVSCTGVLVHERVVLTAAHCVGNIRYVLLDSVNSSDIYTGNGGDVYEVERSIPYDNNWRGSYDLAALVLAESVDDIEPRVIAQDCILEDYLEEGAPVTIVGFGAVDEAGERHVPELMEGETFVQDPGCEEGRGCFPSISPGGEIGAGGNGVDACFGDSGGPLYLNTEEGDFLIGITSRAYDDVHYPCGEGGIYARPDAVLEWIEESTGYELPHPVCNEQPLIQRPSLVKVPKGRKEVIRLGTVNPDPEGDHVWFEVLEEPEFGSVTINGKRVIYTAHPDYLGRDDFSVQVQDDGEYPYAETYEIPIDILVVKRGIRPWRACGCATSAPASGGGLAAIGLVALALFRRRRW